MKNEIKTGAYTAKDGQVFNFQFCTNLSVSKKMAFVNSVVGYVVTNSDYNSIIKDIVFDFEIIHKFTDYDISEIKESEDTLGVIEELLNTTNIVQIVKNNMVEGLYEELEKAVELNIEYKTGIHNNNIINSIEEILNIIGEKVKNLDTNDFNKFVKTYNNVSAKSTPDKLLEAYAKSDIYKKTISNKNKQNTKRNPIKIIGQNKK